jgi:hypothetical protein
VSPVRNRRNRNKIESEDNNDVSTDEADGVPCTAVGLRLVAGLAIMGLMLVKLEE